MELSPNQTSLLLEQQQETLALRILDRQLTRQPELITRYGPSGRQHGLADINHHLAHLAQSLAVASLPLYEDYIAWTNLVQVNRQIPTEDLALTLEIIKEVLQEELPAEAQTGAIEYLEAALTHLPEFATTRPSYLRPDAPLAELAQQYLAALLRVERQTATHLILDAVKAGTAIPVIYQHVFQPVLYEVGHLWELNRVNVAEEHYVTAVTQTIMAQLYPLFITAPRNGHKLMAASILGELHEVGSRVVADFVELAGWDTIYLGASNPASGVVKMLAAQPAQILALSATMTPHLRALTRLITAVRATPVGRTVKILVGGRPFNIEPKLWRQVQADGTAPDAPAALAVIDQWLTEGEG